jgi:polyphosphate kinase 2 (PPK2 family)
MMIPGRVAKSERAHWDDYMRAFEEAFTATSTQARIANAEARRKLAAEPEDETG